MRNALFLTLAGIALVIFGATEPHASSFIGIGTQDFHFELYNGSSYTYSVAPYTYISGDYYYFDYPFRYSSGASYNYFQPGWYNFSPSFYSYPYSASHYSYYPSSYYYYDSTWTYYPNWMGTYAPMYYGNYYYPPQQPTLVGSAYKPVKMADCSQVSVQTQGFTLDAGQTKNETFYIKNDSGSYLDVQNVQVFIDGADAGAHNVNFDSTIQNGSAGKITFDAFAANNPRGPSAQGTVTVYGTFRDGTSCSGNISSNFSVGLSSGAKAQNKIENANKYSGSPYYNTQGSTSYNRAKETQQEWVDVPVAKQNYNSSNNKMAAPSKGNLASAKNPNYASGRTANFDAPSSGTVTTPYGKVQPVAMDCGGLSISTKNISVLAGNSASEYFTFKNFAGEDFLIDSVQAAGSAGAASVAARNDAPRMYAGEMRPIKVSASAGDSINESLGTAYLAIDGHFGSGMRCKMLSDSFSVKVNAPQGNVIGKIRLDVPYTARLDAGSGFIEFGFDNSSARDVTLDIYSQGADVSPSQITLPANTMGRRTIALNGAQDGAKAEYVARSGGMTVLQRYTRIAAAQAAPARALQNDKAAQTNTPPQKISANNEVVIPITASASPAKATQDQGVVKKITNLAGAGFAVLGGDNPYLFAALVIIIITALWVIYRVAAK